jgi:hypothetical protein
MAESEYIGSTRRPVEWSSEGRGKDTGQLHWIQRASGKDILEPTSLAEYLYVIEGDCDGLRHCEKPGNVTLTWAAVTKKEAQACSLRLEIHLQKL